MIQGLIEKVKDKDLSLGAIMVLIGVLIWIIPVKLVLTLFVVYGLVTIFDTQIKQYRMVNLNTLQELTIDGETHQVK